ncbi:hypothetical protein AB1E19_009521 [Capra hircus]
MRKRTARPPPPHAPAEARAPEISPLLAPPGASAPRPDGRRSVPVLTPPSREGARAFLPESSRENVAWAFVTRPRKGRETRAFALPSSHAGGTCRTSHRKLLGHRKKTTFYEHGREPSPRTKPAGALILDFQPPELNHSRKLKSNTFWPLVFSVSLKKLVVFFNFSSLISHFRSSREELSYIQGQGQQPRGATPLSSSRVATERSYPMSKEKAPLTLDVQENTPMHLFPCSSPTTVNFSNLHLQSICHYTQM